MKPFKYFVEDAPTNATGSAVAGTGDDSSTVVIRKKVKVYRRKKRKIDMEAKRVDEARRKDEATKITDLSLKQRRALKKKFKNVGGQLVKKPGKTKSKRKSWDDFGKYASKAYEGVEEERNYRKEYDNYHSQPEQRERNAARLRARRQMEKWGKVKKFDKKDVHHKDNNPLNNEKDNLAVTTQSWNRSEPRLRKEEVSAKEYDSLKKGDTVTIDYKSAMSSGKSTFKVTAKNVVGKSRVGKVTLQSIKNPRSVKSFLYKRGNKVSFAQGDMGASVVSFAKEESINIQERELTPNELKRREEIAKELSDADFKKRYGKDWKSIKIATATNMAKKEETIMGKKYLETKPGSLEESVDRMYDVWRQPQDSIVDEGFSSSLIKKAVKIATQMGGNMTGAVKKIEKIKKGLSNDSAVKDALQLANEQAEEKTKVDGRTKAYKEAIRRIKMRQERNKHLKKEEIEEEVNPTILKVIDMPDEDFDALIENFDEQKLELLDGILKRMAGRLSKAGRAKAAGKKADKIQKKRDKKAGKIKAKRQGASDLKKAKERLGKLKRKNSYTPSGEKIEEAESGDKEAYKKYVEKMLKKFGVNSPADLKGDDKKKFYDALDKGWESDAEKAGQSEDWKKKKSKNVEDEDENPVGKSYNEAAIDDLRKIVKTKSMGKVSGTKVDLFSASAMVQVYDALNDKNKAKVEKMLKDKRGVMTFADFAMSQATKK